jgi:hypothetical protein
MRMVTRAERDGWCPGLFGWHVGEQGEGIFGWHILYGQGVPGLEGMLLPVFDKLDFPRPLPDRWYWDVHHLGQRSDRSTRYDCVVHGFELSLREAMVAAESAMLSTLTRHQQLLILARCSKLMPANVRCPCRRHG